jgi:hypothetical protein
MSQAAPAPEETSTYEFVIDTETGETVPIEQLRTELLGGSGRYIVMYINPGEAQFSYPKRANLQKCKGGEVLHTWYNKRRRTYLDEPKIQFVFQTGNLMPMLQVGSKVAIRQGHDNFLEFMALFDTDPLLSNGQPNHHYVIYNSPLYPYLICKGWFDPAGPTLVHTAQDPFQVTYSIGFSVHSTYPPISDVVKLREAFQDVMSPPASPT